MMIKIFKSYHLFIPGAFKPIKMILLYLIEPVVLFLISQAGAFEPSGFILGGCLFSAFAVESIIDMGVFGGIQKKSSRQTKYLRIPANGLKVLRYGLWGDFLRRVYILFVPAVLAVVYVGEASQLALSRGVLVMAICLTVMELVLFIIRFFDNMVLNIMVTSFSVGAITGFMGVLFSREAYIGKSVNRLSDLAIAGIVMAVCVALVYVRTAIALKKAKEAYYE